MNAKTSPLISFLCDPTSYPPASSIHFPSGDSVTHIETLASHLFLVGPYAYKLKNPLYLDFIDSRDPLRRWHFCEEEMRLNQRLAPGLYREVIGIMRRNDGSFELSPPSPECVDFLLKMCRFESGATLESLLATDPPSSAQLERLAELIATLHLQEPPHPDFPATSVLRRQIEANRPVLLKSLPDSIRIDSLIARQIAAFASNESLFASRAPFFVKKIHGDLHSRNICRFDGELLPFDGIEFNPELNTIDTMNDIAFMVMDLMYQEAWSCLSIFLSHYLRITGDYQGLALIPLLVSYRATVRAKILALSPSGWNADAEKYLLLAETALSWRKPTFIAVGGLSGAGKSTVAHQIGRAQGAVVIRSDYIRKELTGVEDTEPAPSGAYSAEMTARVYELMITRAAAVLAGGLPVVLDATFQSREAQLLVAGLAEIRGAECHCIWCHCRTEIALERIRNRTGDPSDATEEIRARQEAIASFPTGKWQVLSTDGTREEVAASISSKPFEWLRRNHF